MQPKNSSTPLATKDSATIIVFIILLLTLGGAVWYFKSVSMTNVPGGEPQTEENIQPKSEPKTTETTGITSPTASIDTSSWKTFKNERYGFEFRYPKAKNYTIDDFLYEGAYVEISDARDDKTGGPGIKFGPPDSDKKYPDLKTFLSEYQEKDPTIRITKTEYFTLNNIPALRVYEHDDYLGDSEIVYLLKNNIVWSINIFTNGYSEQDRQIFEQILGSFKFTS
jgi:hypothetical protein